MSGVRGTSAGAAVPLCGVELALSAGESARLPRMSRVPSAMETREQEST